MPQDRLHGSGHGVSRSRDARKSSARPIPRPAVEQFEDRLLLSTTWFVSPSGGSNSPGTLAAPFQTIQQAANVAKPGDHVEIEAGVYNETVTPRSSGTAGAPITYEAYNGAKVTINGASPISGWTHYSGNIYSAPMSWDLGEGSNEVFVNGSAINEAAWPNSPTGDFSTPATATMQSVRVSGSTATIYDSALSQPAGTWTGALIHFAPGQGWVDETGMVTSSSPGSITINFVNDGSSELPSAGNPFYLVGKMAALDAAGEWYRNPSNGQLYVWMPNSASPAGQNIQVKQRLYGFNLNNLSNIVIHGISFFATSVEGNYGTNSDTLNGVTDTYVTQNLQTAGGWYVNPMNDGIDLLGSGNVVENSTVAYSSGDGIVVGPNSTVIDDVVHDVAYSGSNAAGIRLIGNSDTVSHDTVYNSGRHGVLAQDPRATITYNTIYRIGLQTTEAGGIYAADVNGEGAVIAYNQIYNIHTPGYGGTAIFTDNSCSNWIIHNNSTWNVDYGLKLNFTSNNDIIYNNTLGATKMSIDTDQQGNWGGVKIYDNIFEAPVLFTAGGSEYNNATSASSANSSQGAGSFSSGASGVVAASAPQTSPPVTTAAVTTTPVTTPPVTTSPTTTTTPSATNKIMAVNYNSGLNVKPDGFGGAGYIYTGDWVAYTLNFGAGVSKLTAAIAGMMPGTMQIRLGSPTGTLLGTLNFSATGAWNNYTAQSTAISKITGTQTVYFVFSGWQYGVCNIDWLQFA